MRWLLLSYLTFLCLNYLGCGVKGDPTPYVKSQQSVDSNPNSEPISEKAKPK